VEEVVLKTLPLEEAPRKKHKTRRPRRPQKRRRKKARKPGKYSSILIPTTLFEEVHQVADEYGFLPKMFTRLMIRQGLSNFLNLGGVLSFPMTPQEEATFVALLKERDIDRRQAEESDA